jgi:choline dehydrogenase-like flavoprotein
MAFLNTSKSRGETYDAVVVGSGAAGGMAAWALTRGGARVLMLESGRNYDPVKETPMFQSFADAPLRGASTPEKPGGFFQANLGGWVVPDEPYLVKSKSKGEWLEAKADNRMTTDQNFMWWRGRMLGGRTNHWGRVSLRMGPLDFKPRSTDGLGFDWPISYEDVAPWYDKVDQLVGIFGSKEGLENNPDSDFFQPPPPPRVYERLLMRGAKKLGIPVIPARMAILTRPLNGRPACFYATSCGRGCSIGANFQSTTVLIPPALATGRLDILTDAQVREVTVDGKGRATGVHFIDKKTGREEHVSAKLVILGASACETGRILLNSRSNRFPQGLGNSTGHLGRWLTDSTGSNLSGRIPLLEGMPVHNEDGVSTMHTYAPWTVERQQEAAKKGVPRGYYMAWSGGRQMPDMGTAGALAGLAGDVYGTKLKEEARRYYGSFVDLHARGEMIPNEKSFMELDAVKKDRWGIPVARFHFEWSEAEVKQVDDMQVRFAEMIEAAGGVIEKRPAAHQRMTAGGSVNHEMGVARMSAKAEDGVTDGYGRLWDCPNVMVADGAVFCSNPFKNPTISILALAWRGCEHLLEEVRKGNL